MHRLVEQRDPLLYRCGLRHRFGQCSVLLRQVALPHLLGKLGNCHKWIPGLSGAVLFNGEVPNTPVLALRCDFSGVISGKAIPYAGYPVVGSIAS